MVSSSMLLPNLILLIDLTFSTPTRFIANYRRARLRSLTIRLVSFPGLDLGERMT